MIATILMLLLLVGSYLALGGLCEDVIAPASSRPIDHPAASRDTNNSAGIWPSYILLFVSVSPRDARMHRHGAGSDHAFSSGSERPSTENAVQFDERVIGGGATLTPREYDLHSAPCRDIMSLEIATPTRPSWRRCG